jgi:hypothetical protein
MNKSLIRIALFTALSATALSSCKKDKDAPVPDEQEVITTVKLNVSNSSGFSRSFVYKIENGFNNTTPGSVQIDTVKLPAGQVYDATLVVLNEKADPAEDITAEIKEKNLEHLFVFASQPATGAGSLSVTDGDKDDDGKPLNLHFKLNTGTAGNGRFTVQLMHQPVNKSGTTPETAGGETDLKAVYPVVIQ